MGKLATPDWVKEGFDSKADWEKKHGLGKKKKSAEGKVFKLRLCPKCGSDSVMVVLTGEEGKGAKEWECKKCKWTGKNIEEKEVTEDEFMEYLDKKGEEVA
jgi:hypothetical protein